MVLQRAGKFKSKEMIVKFCRKVERKTLLFAKQETLKKDSSICVMLGKVQKSGVYNGGCDIEYSLTLINKHYM